MKELLDDEFAVTACRLRRRTGLVPVAMRAALVPGYVSLISGAGVEQLKQGRLFRKVVLNSTAFIIGFSIVFITLGAISTEVGQVLVQYKSLLARVAGAVIILFGLHLTGILSGPGRGGCTRGQPEELRLSI
jgi:cytochrome c biogenesis protein CcdA